MKKKIKIAVLGAAEIAFRRFMPALIQNENFEYVGVAYYREQDAQKVIAFQENYGGSIIKGFDSVFNDSGIDAVYVPQPPALHYKFGLDVLKFGKHLFMEKPFTTSLKDTEELISIAKTKGLAVNENYMFRFHKQICDFVKLCKEGIVGKINHYEVRFCFPLRSQNDFRYLKALGGGALLDCGGYTIMLSNILVGGDGIIHPNSPIYEKGFEVDMHGSGIMESKSTHLTCSFYYGMDDQYSCYAKAFGDKGILLAPRVLTAPSDLDVFFDVLDLKRKLIKQILIGKDDSFFKSIDNFKESIINPSMRMENYDKILQQANYIEEMKRKQK